MATEDKQEKHLMCFLHAIYHKSPNVKTLIVREVSSIHLSNRFLF